MRKKIIIGTFICMGCLIGLFSPVGAATRTALVIGNSNYKSAPLRNPVNDARDMAKTLRSLKFDVIERLNADEKQMVLAIDEFYKRLKRADVGVFYFAGHGMQIHGVNYLIPVKAQVTSETDVQFEAVDAGRVLGKMRSAGNKLNIVILDACRDNPFKRSFRTESKGLAQMDAPKGTIIAYATSPGSVAADGSGRNGIYTKHLLINLRASGMSVQDVFMEAGLGVMRETGEKQVPWISSTPVPRYYMAGKGSGGNDAERRRFEEEQARLEKERREFEQAKLEFERKRQKSQSQKVEVASVPEKSSYSRPSSSTSNVLQQDGVYVAYANGIVRDTKTGLEWKAGPDENTTWNEARSWVQSLNLDGGGWRMPTIAELEGLSRTMTPLLKTTGWWVWSGETTHGSSSAWFFYVYLGYKDWNIRDDSYNGRAFAVRSQSGGLDSEKLGRRDAPKHTPSPPKLNEIKRDGVYVAYANGIVKDSSTGLEWKAGPDKDTDWNEARSWVQSLNLDGGGWRMPTIYELAGLYNKGAGDRNMTPLLKTTGWWVWSGETEGSAGARFFHNGSGGMAWGGRNDRDCSDYGRGFAVRSRSDG
jgi:hypothetical protein